MSILGDNTLFPYHLCAVDNAWLQKTYALFHRYGLAYQKLLVLCPQRWTMDNIGGSYYGIDFEHILHSTGKETTLGICFGRLHTIHHTVFLGNRWFQLLYQQLFEIQRLVWLYRYSYYFYAVDIPLGLHTTDRIRTEHQHSQQQNTPKPFNERR